MAKINVTQRQSSVGNQVFVFRLSNGRTVEFEFCPHLIDPHGDASCAVVSLLGENGERLQVGVSDSSGEKTMMKLPSLWFTSPEEDEKNNQMVRDVLGTLKERLNPKE